MKDYKYEELEKKIEYTFQDKDNLVTALTHKSFVNEKTCVRPESYERYEFLGDAILEYIISEHLFKAYPDKTEGELTKLRASLVCEFTLSKISRELGLGEHGRFSRGERNTGGQNRDSILCDMFESVLGGIYIDGGMEPARKFVNKFLLTDIEHKQLFYDAKSYLQEYCQKKNITLVYEVMEESGPEHDKKFVVQAMLGEKKGADGHGHNKKTAEQMAAYNTLNLINYKP